MITLENNEGNAIIKALEEGTSRERRYAANLLDGKIRQAEQSAMVAINKSQSDIIKEQGVKEYLALQESLGLEIKNTTKK